MVLVIRKTTTKGPIMSTTDAEKLEKVELIREKTGVSYEDARAALEETDYDLLDAVVLLERQGKTTTHTASGSTASSDNSSSAQMVEAQLIYENDTRRMGFEEKLNRLFAWIQSLLRRSVDIKLVATKHDMQSLSIPLLLVILLLILAFWIVLPLMVVSLFFDFRYHFEGISSITVDLNDLSQKASNTAEYIKQEAKDLHDTYDHHDKK